MPHAAVFRAWQAAITNVRRQTARGAQPARTPPSRHTSDLNRYFGCTSSRMLSRQGHLQAPRSSFSRFLTCRWTVCSCSSKSMQLCHPYTPKFIGRRMRHKPANLCTTQPALTRLLLATTDTAVDVATTAGRRSLTTEERVPKGRTGSRALFVSVASVRGKRSVTKTQRHEKHVSTNYTNVAWCYVANMPLPTSLLGVTLCAYQFVCLPICLLALAVAVPDDLALRASHPGG